MSRSYTFVTTLNSLSHNLKERELYEEMRLIVRIFNKTEGTNFRLSRTGRLGANSEYALLYKNRIDGRTYQKIRVGDASRFDIYVHSRESFSVDRVTHKRLVGMLRNWVSIR